jgi:acyl-CoA thioester hydrolase
MHGIVNNAVYLNYLEHARRAFLKSRGFGFHEITAQRVQLRMAQMTIKYRRPLVSGDGYVVRLGLKRVNGLMAFRGDIFRTADDVLCAASLAKIAVLKDGVLTSAAFFDNLL